MTPVPPHLAGLPVLSAGQRIIVRPAAFSHNTYATVATTDELWELLSDDHRWDLLHVSLMLTRNEKRSAEVSQVIGEFRLYEDNEIWAPKTIAPCHQLDLSLKRPLSPA